MQRARVAKFEEHAREKKFTATKTFAKRKTADIKFIASCLEIRWRGLRLMLLSGQNS